MRDASDPTGHLLTVGIPGPRLDAATRRALERLAPSGVVLFARNVENVEQLCELTAALHALPSRPLVAIDHEGGRVLRLAPPFTQFPPAADVGRAGADAAFAVGAAIGRELGAVGVDLDYAPVLDVHSNAANPVVGDRAFSSDPTAAGRLAVAFMRGLRSAGVIACGKHFPGHGATDRDSHVELPIVGRARTEIETVDLVPFRAAIADGIPSLMTAHVLYTALDPDHPATLSSAILDTLLRHDLGFRGVVISDDLGMRAVTDHAVVPEAAVDSLAAGVDWLLVCHELEQAQEVGEHIRTALARGALSAGRLQASAARIAALRRGRASAAPLALPVAAHQSLNERVRAVAAAARAC